MKFLKAISRDGGGDTNIEIPYSENVLMRSTTLSSARLLALDSNPVSLLPAPGGRFYYFVSAFLLHYRFGTMPYTCSNDYGPGFGQSDLAIGFGAAPFSNATLIDQPLASSGASFPATDLFVQTEDAYIAAPIPAGYSDWLASDIENAEVTLQFSNGAALASGDGALTVRLWYSLINGAP
jgi:hypothetical protein